MRIAILTFLILLTPFVQARAQDRVIVLGDSLTAGYGLPQGEDFATKLESALIAKGHNVKIQNAGISGDTTAGGLMRLGQVIGGEPRPRLVIVALGANDMLRRIDPATAKKNLSAILKTLKDNKIPAFLIGIQNPMGMGAFLRGPYGKIYDDLADEYDIPLYPFFLKGVAMDKALNQPDGMHPNEKGVAIMVKNIAPEISDALE
jgi:acyl-CoA thioesterase-1